MTYSKYILLLALMALTLPLCSAQENQAGSEPPKEKPVPQFQEPAPFPLEPSPLAKGFTIEVRTPDQMTEQDRLLEADAESSIAERAGFADLEFNAGKWSYRQLVCPDFPNHLFLRFTRDNGVGDQSVFSASIPRNGEGHVRIIPILKRSYSLFSPAPINEITIGMFNHIRIEEKAEGTPSWEGTALCYAALAGANPVAVPQGDTSGQDGFPAASAPELEVPLQGSGIIDRSDGGEVVYLGDASAKPKPVVWTMTFNKKGRLLKVKRPFDEVNKPKPVPTGPTPKEKPVPATVAAN
jgi:hypothetical protein